MSRHIRQAADIERRLRVRVRRLRAGETTASLTGVGTEMLEAADAIHALRCDWFDGEDWAELEPEEVVRRQEAVGRVLQAMPETRDGVPAHLVTDVHHRMYGRSTRIEFVQEGSAMRVWAWFQNRRGESLKYPIAICFADASVIR